MPDPYIVHSDIQTYANDKVNIKKEDLTEYRAQVNRLRENLTEYINAHPDYSLIKMLSSGSVAKGTALKTLNDMDVAVYIKKTDKEQSETDLIDWLVEQLREAYKSKGIKPEQIRASTHCATIHFAGSGLDVDVSPVIYDGGLDDRGYLINKDTGKRVLTSIPLHLKFIRDRKAKQANFTQIVRLVKWWIKNQKRVNEAFRFKSFMADMICAHLFDSGQDMSDFVKSLEAFFSYIVRTSLKERISFTDNYKSSELPANKTTAIEIFDPVNPANNVAVSYTDSDRLVIVEAAHDALDAIHEAQYANTKGRAVDCWKRIFGPSFNF